MDCRFCGRELKWIGTISNNNIYKCINCKKILMSAIQHDITETLKKIWLEEDIKKDFQIP